MTPPVRTRQLTGAFIRIGFDHADTGDDTAKGCVGGVMTPPYDFYDVKYRIRRYRL